MYKNYEYKIFSSNGGYSNSFFSILCQGGLLFASAYAYPIFKALIDRNNFLRIFVALTYILLLITTIFHTAYINFFIWVLLIDNDLWEKINKRKEKSLINSFPFCGTIDQ